MRDRTFSLRVSPAALLSVVLGLTGPLGLVFGYWSLYQINASDGRLRGRYLAYVGIGFGTITSMLLLIGAVAIAVTQMRVASGRAECANNLRQIGAAVQHYYDDHNKFYPTGTVGPPELPPQKRVTFFAALLPYLEQRPGIRVKNADVAKTLDVRQPWDAAANDTARQTTIASFLCRDDTGLPPEGRGMTN